VILTGKMGKEFTGIVFVIAAELHPFTHQAWLGV
jgi:hypothetical protein